MALQILQHLQGRALADIVDVFIRQAVQADAAGICDAALTHDVCDAAQDEFRHGVIRQAGAFDQLGQHRVIPHQEPRVDADAMAADAGAGVQDIDPGVLIGDADDLVDIHPVAAADLGQLVGISNVDIAECILHDLCHLRRADIRHNNLALAEGRIGGLDLFANGGLVGADGPGVVLQLIDHIAGG